MILLLDLLIALELKVRQGIGHLILWQSINEDKF